MPYMLSRSNFNHDLSGWRVGSVMASNGFSDNSAFSAPKPPFNTNNNCN